jgi:hypothetical protein
MVSPISGSYGANLISSMNRVQSPMAGAKVSGAGAVDGQSMQGLSEAVSALEKMIEQLVATLKKQGAGAAGGAGGAEGVGAAGGAGGGGGGGGMNMQDSFSPAAASSAPAGMPSLDGTGSGLLDGIEISDPKLRQALELIATHPDGAKLIAAAKAQGLTSIGANPALNPDGGAGTEGLHIPGQGRIEIANVNSENLIHVLAHELGHAATNGDGNSQLEEQTVDALGEKIHQDLMGQASSFNLDLGSYSDLAMQNDVLNSLRNIGVRV